jgi:hypothetical protein
MNELAVAVSELSHASPEWIESLRLFARLGIRDPELRRADAAVEPDHAKV